jgi:glutamate synthase domain-containing protein 3
MIGSVIPVIGTAVGAAVGGALGGASALFAASREGRAFGGGMDGGKTYLVGERGPEMVTPGTKSTVTANNDLKSTFDTSALETKMASLVTEMNSANKTLTNMVNGVNTLVAVESRALKAVETTARKDRNQVGLV